MQADSNVDPEEIAKFNALASRWWDPDSEFKPLHDINPLRLNYIIEQAGGLKNKKILDIGCGGGILSESMAKAGADVTGIDMGELPLKVARLHQLESGIQVNYQQATSEQYAAQYPHQFDIVTCMELLEHVPSPKATVQDCANLVKPGGHVFFSTINRNLKAFLLAIVGAEYLLKMLPKGTHEYKKFIKPAELGRWSRYAGLKLQDLSGMSYNPISKTYKITQDVSVNYLFAFINSELT